MKAAKPKPKLDTTFDCPFCNSEKSIEVKMDRQKKIGTLRCRMCHREVTLSLEEDKLGMMMVDMCAKIESGEPRRSCACCIFQQLVDLHEPVDVYAHWVDQCEELNQREREDRSSKRRRLDEDSVSESESGESDY